MAGGSSEISSARHLTEVERSRFAPWFAAIALYSVTDTTGVALSLNLGEVSDILGRKSSHQFPGCDNRVWILTEDEEAALVAASTAKTAACDAVKAAREAEPVTISAVCPLCGTHCYGDCTASR